MSGEARLWRLRRVYLDHVGAESVRFLDVWLDFTSRYGNPLDTILWMRNGGGKSTVLSLLCALIRPKRSDFLGAATGRHLEALILGADTAHVMVEWVDPTGRRLVTGAAYEWAGRNQPADPTAAHDKLGVRWYAFTPVDVATEIDNLGWVGRNGQHVDLTKVDAAIKAMPALAEAVVVGSAHPTMWAQVLRDRGIDPGLFTAILKINATEGGIENQFKFKTPDDFVQYLLSLIRDTSAADRITKLLTTHRDRIQLQPRMRAEIDFCDEADGHLADLIRARDQITAATASHHVALTATRSLAASLAGAARQATSEANAHSIVAKDHRIAAKRDLEAATRHDFEAREYQWWASHYAARAADDEVLQSTADLETAENAERSWQLVPDIHHQIRLTQRLAIERQRHEEASAGEAPARRHRATAAANLAAVLTVTAATLDAEAAANAAAADTAAEQRDNARAAGNQVHAEIGALDSRRGELVRVIEAHDRRIAKAVTDGHLSEPDALAEEHAAAIAAENDSTKQLHDVLPTAAAAIANERQPLLAERAAAVTEQGELKLTWQDLQAKKRPLHDEIEVLATNHRLTALLAADRVHPLQDTATLLTLLDDALLHGDRQRVGYALDDLEDERLLGGLSSPAGLLPASRSVEHASTVIADYPHTTGWQYLADSVPSDRWLATITAVPHLVAGLLTHDPADTTVAQALLAAQPSPGEPIVVSSTTALQAVIDKADQPSGDFLVVTPAPALYDRTDATQETSRRVAARETRIGRTNALTDQIEADTDLRRRLIALSAACPPGHLDHLNSQLDRADRDLRAINDRIAAIDIRLAELVEAETALEQARQEAATKQQAATRRIRVLSPIIDVLESVTTARTELGAYPARRADLDAKLGAQRTLERQHDQNHRRESGHADTKKASARHHRRRITDLAATAADTPPDPDLPNLPDATEAYKAADDAYRALTTGDAIAAVIDELAKQLAALTSRLNAETPEVLALAMVTASTASSDDPDAIHTAAQEARGRRTAAHETHTRCKVAAEQQRGRHIDNTKLRPSAVDLMTPVTAPADQGQANQLAEVARSQHAEHVGAARDHTDQAADTEQLANTAVHRSEELRQAIKDLLGADATVDDRGVEPFTGDTDHIRDLVRGHRADLTQAERDVNEARVRLGQSITAINAWASQDRFSLVTAEVRNRFRGENIADAVAVQAEETGDRLRVFRSSLAHELSAIDQDKAIIIDALRDQVRDSLATLNRAQNLAVMPDGVATHLHNRRYLEVGIRSTVDTHEPALRVRIERLIDDLVNRTGNIPDGFPLIWEAVLACVGRGNFRATGLKPDVAPTEIRVSIEQIGVWSGGEKITINVLLFCLAARLRATNRGTDIPGLGMLPMDNPLGSANHVTFLDLQRRVAAANGIQLVFLSGLGDMRAVGRFPNIVRMRNASHNGRSYARVDQRDITDDGQPPITTARLTLPTQETLL